MEFKCCLLLLLLVALVTGQGRDDETRNIIQKAFDLDGSWEEVTKEPDGSLGALEKCGEGSEKGKKTCVVYYMCYGGNNTIIQTGITDGFGVIDIRFGASSCPGSLEVCCGIPEGGLDPNLPQPGETLPPPPPTSTMSPDNQNGPGPYPTTPTPERSFCGIRNPDGIDFKITGNKNREAEYGEFPWMIAVLDNNYVPNDPNKKMLLCGGSLITPKVVLTAAHCVYKLNPKDIRVRAGEWDTQTTDERLPYQERNVKNIIVHEQFVPNTLPNDIALLILDRMVDKYENVGTICLTSQNQQIDSKKCFVSGWGKDVFGRQGAYQAILKKVQLPTVPREQCQNALRKTRLGSQFILHESFMCAGGEGGKDACTGDGGSPLVCPDPYSPQRYVQVGIVAWGIGCGEENVPGVYADVTKFRSWIDSNMERLNIDTAPYNL